MLGELLGATCGLEGVLGEFTAPLLWSWSPCQGPCWFTNKTVSGFNLAFSASYPEQAGRAIAAAAGRRLQVQVEALPLAEAVEAHRRSESGRTTGKLVLDMQR